MGTMTRYKSFGAFLNQYVGWNDDIVSLKREFKRQISREPRNAQPWMWRTPAAVHDLVKGRYADRDVLARQLLIAKAAYLSPEHERQVRSYQGYHSRKKHTWEG